MIGKAYGARRIFRRLRAARDAKARQHAPCCSELADAQRAADVLFAGVGRLFDSLRSPAGRALAITTAGDRLCHPPRDRLSPSS